MWEMGHSPSGYHSSVANKIYTALVSLLPPPRIPWQITGNHWIALPCIHPADASIHAVGMLHRGARSAIEFAGGRGLRRRHRAAARPPDARHGWRTPRACPMFRSRGSARSAGFRRSRARSPTCSCAERSSRRTAATPTSRARCTRCRSRIAGGATRSIDVSLDGHAGHRQLRVRTPRPFEDAVRVVARRRRARCCSRGRRCRVSRRWRFVADGDARRSRSTARDYSISPRRSRVRGRRRASRSRSTSPSARSATAPRRRPACCDAADGASCCRRRATRCRALEQTSGNEAIDRLINRNLLVRVLLRRRPRARRRAVLSGSHARAVERTRRDRARLGSARRGRFPPCNSPIRRWRASCCCACASCTATRRAAACTTSTARCSSPASRSREWPAIRSRPTATSATPATIASSTSRCSPTRCICVADDLDARRDKRIPLYSTEVSPSGAPVAHPFTLHANATVAHALEVLRRTLDEETARGAPGSRRRACGDPPPLRRRASAKRGNHATCRHRRIDLARRSTRGATSERRPVGVGVLAADLRGGRRDRTRRIVAR